VSQYVSEYAVAQVISKALSRLFDPRLSATTQSSSCPQLDASVCTGLVREINKLAIQAAMGANRQISFQALLSLQLQFGSSDSRLPKIIAKLFGKVLKAEENSSLSFARKNFDINHLLCFIENTLVQIEDMRQKENESKNGESSNSLESVLVSCTDMIKSLLQSMLKHRGLDVLNNVFVEKGIEPGNSLVDRLIVSCKVEKDATEN